MQDQSNKRYVRILWREPNLLKTLEKTQINKKKYHKHGEEGLLSLTYELPPNELIYSMEFQGISWNLTS